MSAPTEDIHLKSTPLDFSKSPDFTRLKGRSVLITGATRGIGLAYATKLAEVGAIVTISDLRTELGEAAVRELTSKGLQVQFVQYDVASYTPQVALFQRAIIFGEGKIDVVVPNAGICAEQNLFNMIPTGWLDLSIELPKPGYSTMGVNLQGVYYFCYLALHYFRLPRDATFAPSIILIASLAGYAGFTSSATYSMSKFGVRGLFYGTRDCAAMANPSVRMNLVAPWFIPTAMTAQKDFQASEAGAMMKAMRTAQLDGVVQAVICFSVDETAHGRAAGIFPQGIHDLEDDLEGGFAGQKTDQGILDILATKTAATGKQVNELMRQDSATGRARQFHENCAMIYRTACYTL